MQDTCPAPEVYLPESLLKQATDLSGYLRIATHSVEWFIYVHYGQIVYASNSVDPFERLERYLRSLSQDLPQLSAESRSLVRARFETSAQPDSPLTPDYQAIAWMVEQNWLDPLLAGTLASKLTAEVFESYLLLPEAEYTIRWEKIPGLPKFCALDIDSLVERTQARLRMWQSLYPRVYSPYQRPYLAGVAIAQQKLSPEAVHSLSRLLIGLNFRQLGLFLKQDELQIAQRFVTLIAEGIILLRDPITPFDRLPQLGRSGNGGSGHRGIESAKTMSSTTALRSSEQDILSSSLATTAQRTWKIVCVDDSPSMLNEIKRLLESEAFEITLVNDSKRALMQIVSIQPDLILMDVSMPEINGYQLCSLLQKAPNLQHIPVIMVTGNRSLLDRARAKMVGATDYLTKPFSQKDLLAIVLRYLGH